MRKCVNGNLKNKHSNTCSRATCLSCQDMLHFTGSNTECQSTKRSMSCSVRVSTNRDTSWKSKSLFRSNNMDNSLTFIGHSKVFEPEIFDVLFELQHLCSTGSLFNKSRDINQLRSVFGGNIVIDRRQGAIRSADAAPGKSQAFKGLRRRHLVDQMAIDVEQTRQSIIFNNVIIPNLVVQSTGFGGGIQRCRRR